MQMEVICAWCSKPLGKKECQTSNLAEVQFPVSHGICDECKEKVLASIEKALGEETKTS